MNNKTFDQELTELLNRYSKENDSGTPDYILAKYLMGCLETFNMTIELRNKWYGVTMVTGKKETIINKPDISLAYLMEKRMFETNWEIELICRKDMPLCPLGHNGKTIPNNNYKILEVRLRDEKFALGEATKNGIIKEFVYDSGLQYVYVKLDEGDKPFIDIADLRKLK